MRMFWGLCLLALPVFLLIFLEKLVDLHSYRKKLHSKNQVMPFLPYLLVITGIIAFSHLLSVLMKWLLMNSEISNIIIPVLLLSLLCPFFTLLILYLIERKWINVTLQETTLIKESYDVNLILSFAFFVLYAAFLVWDFLTFAEIVILPTPKDHYVLTKADLILYIGTVLFILLFALIKIISQKKLVKRDNQIKN